ncbi:MAG: epoxyqueuosine reductase QueH [Clostridium sp.]|jgi:predicted adenine nucleotide alpha hydrolase (AANH) superfamily ATPase|nr:epoxyqueuosine reductase QueH [Clostridium sp.]
MNKINYHKLMIAEIESIKSKGQRPKLVLHSCCAPCSTHVLEVLNETFNLEILFFNPNIYPKEEYHKRLQEQIHLIPKMELDIKVAKTDYESHLFYEKVKGLENLGEGSERCKQCISLRLEKTAMYAAENKFDYFTSTLSISPLKNADIINEIGQSLQDKYSVKFLIADFKKNNGFKNSIDLSKKYNLYRQDYCGCIFSKKERESKNNK